MKLSLFLVASLLVSIVVMAFAADGPDQMIVNALICWLPAAIYAFAARNYKTWIAQYVGPSIALALMLAIMLNGMS
ncbi:hypothetical protein [Qipengyuania aquimaris]|uniref:Uncharacterized protein n=1 Tax=Qipengyuania aquimaris TaxID=255984 RepID=A0A9Q3XES5_9SPHN|nr:hypothetical protein [Qipengyuania aquimaris]MBY6219011.1 hypothetical protein [Qipengyuania aquimaris]